MSEKEDTQPTGSDEKSATVSAKKFDFLSIFEEAQIIAKERNFERNKEALIAESIKDDPEPSTSAKPLSADDEEVTEESEQAVDSEESLKVRSKGDLDNRDPLFIPIQEELVLLHGVKPLTALAVDPSGARVATGGFDFDIKLWDFGGMDGACRSFKAIKPCEEHQIKHMEFSPTGEYLMAISGAAQAQIVTRDGEPVCFTNKGFQYIMDPASAKGHTHGLHWGCWHPLETSKFLTCSQDCTLRIWDVEDAETMMNETRIPTHKFVLKPRSVQGRKVVPLTCSYSKDGQMIIAGCQDGSLQVWDTRKKYVNTCQLIRNAHPVNTTITCVAWSWDGRQIATRAMDDTVKLWDARQTSKGPVHTVTNLPVLFDQTEITFSPNDHIIATGVSAPRNDPKGGAIAFFRRDNFKPLKQFKPGHGSVIGLTWHHRINQIFCTSSDGSAMVRYDNEESHNGAILCVKRQALNATRRRRQGGGGSEAYVKPYLLTYNEDGLRSARKTKKHNQPGSEYEVAMAAANAQLQTDRHTANALANEQARARVPEQEKMLGNRVGSLHQYMVQQIVLQKKDADEFAERDIRGAILRHAPGAQEKPFWTKAYLK